jgi:hypothetical protein
MTNTTTLPPCPPQRTCTPTTSTTAPSTTTTAPTTTTSPETTTTAPTTTAPTTTPTTVATTTVPGNSPTPPQLADTGISLGLVSFVGVLLIVVGLMVRAAARRAQRDPWPDAEAERQKAWDRMYADARRHGVG